jgi:hypothetical protein
MTFTRAMAIASADYAEGNAKAGIHEQGGNNLGPQIQAWQANTGGVPGESWCQDYAYSMQLKAWCVSKNLLTGKTDADNQAIMRQHADAFSADTGIARTGSCQASYGAARAHGRARPKDFTPSRGDQVYYDFPVKGKRLRRAHHTGIVLEVLPDGDLLVGEGNTPASGGNQSDGDGVFIKRRGREFVYGFAHFA